MSSLTETMLFHDLWSYSSLLLGLAVLKHKNNATQKFPQAKGNVRLHHKGSCYYRNNHIDDFNVFFSGFFCLRWASFKS